MRMVRTAVLRNVTNYSRHSSNMDLLILTETNGNYLSDMENLNMQSAKCTVLLYTLTHALLCSSNPKLQLLVIPNHQYLYILP